MLQLISLVMLGYAFFLVRASLPELPPRIPTHFNAAGDPDGWGRPDVLWHVLGAQALVTVVFLIVPYLGQRFPSLIHFGSRRMSDFTTSQRERMLPMLNDMAGYLSIVMNIFFTYMLRAIIQAAQQIHPSLHMGWPLGFLLGGTACILVYYFWKFSLAARERGED
jgi:uncharacterized membrane protein